MEGGPAHHRRGISGDFEFYPPGADGAGGGRRLVYELLRRGGERVSFDPIVAAGANGSKPHASPETR